MNIQYIGEHLMPGMIGKAFVWVSFAAAIVATVLYIMNLRRKHEPLKQIRFFARGFFIVHVFSLILVAVILYYAIFRHYFEYAYVWQYSSSLLPVKYIISCFWAGQEGSFLVWAVFQALIGLVLIFISRDWEDHVLSVVSLSQVFVTSMMLGVTFLSFKIGGSPFSLLRESYSAAKETIFQQPDYLKMITDGNGLNPLLENIWMTIHPPILFLGYALALVPFAYAIAGLVRKEYTAWIKPAIPWTLLSLTLLGAGILLGGAWAYVSLTFGGFWSWDPVENSSLVPWMTLVAGLHFLMIARKQRHALLAAFTLITISYVLVLYASFLTRSGVLADSSAHSFGDNGMTAQLLVFLLVFLAMAIGFIVFHARKFAEKKNEILLSREFWMFLGSLIVVLAAFQVIFTTSLPVFNTLFKTNIAPPADRVGFYNQWQTPFVLLIAGFIAFTQFLHYNENSGRVFLKKMAGPLVLSILILIPFIVSGIVSKMSLTLAMFFVLFSIFSSLYNLMFQSARPRNLAAIITHTGFLLFVLGTIMTFSNSKTISSNTSKYDLGNVKSNSENLLLIKGDTLGMSGFYVVYNNRSTSGNTTTYAVDFLKKIEKDKKEKYVKVFTLNPSINRNPRMGDVYNPDTRHFLWKDYYTYISSSGINEENDYIVIKAILNPYINVLWAGAILMTIGFSYAFLRRMRKRLLNNT
ncbi:MAG: cytochrome c biogenesis protein CcsA [Bacteroidetes bacterium]|nr:cytochrome c biogenesis protein CcsA [Bacteroidota bacterium]